MTGRTIIVPVKTPSVLNLREHWGRKAARAKAHREAAWASCQYANPRRPALPVVVRLVRISPRKLDGDNLQGALKAVRDGIADWLGVDDGHDAVTWEYGQEQGKPACVRVEISPK